MAAGTVNLTVQADLANLRTQLASIPGITREQAVAMVRELERATNAASRSAQQAAQRSQQASQQAQQAAQNAADDAETMSERLKTAGDRTKKMTDLFAGLSPEVAAFGGMVADLGDGFEALDQAVGLCTASTSALLVVFGAAAVAFAVYNDSLREQAELERIRAEAADNVNTIMSDRENVITELMFLEGQYTQTEYERLKLEEQQKARRSEKIQAMDAEIQKNREAIEMNQAIAGSLGFVTFGLLESAQAMGFFGEQTSTLVRVNAELARSKRAQIEAIDEQAAAEFFLLGQQQRLRDEAEAQKAADKARAAAAKEAAEADRLAAEQARERTAAYREALAMMDEESRAQKEALGIAEQFQKSTQARIDAQLDGADAINASMERELEKTLEMYQKGTAAAGANNRAQIALNEAYQIEVNSIEQAAFDKRMALLEKEKEATKEAREEQKELIQSAIQEGADFALSALDENASTQQSIVEELQARLESGADSMTVAEKERLKEQINAQRQAAIQAFEVAKLAKLAEATVNVATAVTANLANPIAAGIVAAIGAAQIAQIAATPAPSFHSGGMVGGAPDEVGARLLTGEAVLSRAGRSVIGDETIQAANAGISAPMRVVAINQYRHEVFRPFIRDHLRLGSELSSAIRGTRVVGQREAI